MSSIALPNGRLVGDYLAPYFVAELNTSHFGNLDTARSMIDEAKAAGCDCVKFQSWSAESLYSEAYYRQNPIAKRMVTKFALSDAELAELAAHCRAVGIDFASTPYSHAEAEFLVATCRVPFLKVASMELNNLPYLAHLAGLGVPLVLSTGMGRLDEIVRAVETIEAAGNGEIVILHCTSVYPSPPETIRLRNIEGLREAFPAHPIGYSDHSLGSEIPAAAVALGACLIEKHFTLDSSKIGMDNQMATEPADMARMIAACRTVHAALGGTERLLSDAELAQIPKMRRSVIAARGLKAGEVLAAGDLETKRPGDGIPPTELATLIGRTLARDVEAGALLARDDVA
ncbi:N-acetylneuraminate synthase family protein [Novosphingobium sp. JCM 18896]|uniref:N-acetylneuraminate synthase family protein n=1 Tax=Novosphingobium sp. JCM 18896 TaxID=2989731 RepID=UPI0022222637|nr:N-acetylneuraminate synthase family protein [Novosphingobium sp. JCM 18896]MCW1429395.1 N-acetylneuraminate synthase family protein [Novosphingobium sp. JCM 18896]